MLLQLLIVIIACSFSSQALRIYHVNTVRARVTLEAAHFITHSPSYSIDNQRGPRRTFRLLGINKDDAFPDKPPKKKKSSVTTGERKTTTQFTIEDVLTPPSSTPAATSRSPIQNPTTSKISTDVAVKPSKKYGISSGKRPAVSEQQPTRTASAAVVEPVAPTKDVSKGPVTKKTQVTNDLVSVAPKISGWTPHYATIKWY